MQRVFVERGVAVLQSYIGDDGAARVPFTAFVLLARPADSRVESTA